MPFWFVCRVTHISSSFAALEAMATYATSDAFTSKGEHVNCIALFNHEEVGSISTSGAQSSLIPILIQRLSPTTEAYAQSVARSFLISADMSHSIHPNYKSKHDSNHAPRINGGVIIKTNEKQHYTSDAIGSFVIKQLADGGRVQNFGARNDMYVSLVLRNSGPVATY